MGNWSHCTKTIHQKLANIEPFKHENNNETFLNPSYGRLVRILRIYIIHDRKRKNVVLRFRKK